VKESINYRFKLKCSVQCVALTEIKQVDNLHGGKDSVFIRVT
jgi:hypothetical protein